MTIMSNRDLLRRLVLTAVTEMARYPQYAGAYDGCGLARIVSTRGLRPRGRRMWPVGTLAAGKPAEYNLPGDDGLLPTDVVLYKPGYGDTRLPAYCVEWIIPPTDRMMPQGGH